MDFNSLYSGFLHLLKNKFFLAFFVFTIWILFFDRNRLQVQVHLSQTVDQLEEDKAHYEQEYTKMKEELNTINEDLEKYAREKYYLKKKNEEVFIIDN